MTDRIFLDTNIIVYTLDSENIIASAIHAGCNILYTEDLKNHQIIDNLLIVNPFN